MSLRTNGNHQAYTPTFGAAFCPKTGSLSHSNGLWIDFYQIIYAHLTGLQNSPLLDIFYTNRFSAFNVFT
ncbi:MAG TPA: hypothetical protein VL995_02520 [Cellvibrio sp.]|nr:hypothetical protein [Cellvibrio sp.]